MGYSPGDVGQVCCVQVPFGIPRWLQDWLQSSMLHPFTESTAAQRTITWVSKYNKMLQTVITSKKDIILNNNKNSYPVEL